MTSEQIRKSFLDFFAGKGHKVMAGTSLIPSDPTTLFTSAGVQQFVPAFRGDVPVVYPRAATCQKCLRTDDIEYVGDTTHCTFFEMLGNFSIGDYFKKEAIEWAWEYSVEVVKLPKEQLWVSVYPADEEAVAAWRRVGVREERIVRLEENWWPLSPTWVGSTGPCSELFLDLGEGVGCGKIDCGPDCNCGRFVEYWNLVFPEYFQEGSIEKRRPLDRPGVDTGLGLDRFTAVLQGKDNIYDSDLFAPIMAAIHRRAKEMNSDYQPAKEGKGLRAARIVADHSRAVAFALAEGVMPSNEGRGYVIRKLLRRASYFGWRLGGALEDRDTGFDKFVTPVVDAVCQRMGKVYPELLTTHKFILENVGAEEERFEAAILSGFPHLERTIRNASGRLAGEDVFRFYDTYGIPLDLTREIAAESGLEVDEAGFEAELAKQRARSRAATGDKFAIRRSGAYQEFIGQTEFVGYEELEADCRVIGIIQEGEKVERFSAGEAEIILDRTPFYAEQGGQVGDRGRLETEGGSCVVEETGFAIEGVIAHRAKWERGELKLGDTVRALVDGERRRAIARAHTATHLLHYALRKTLGPHALQAGSLVEADWLRFDFSHFERVPQEQLDEIAELVNRMVLESNLVSSTVTDIETARQMGAMALFGEKYGDKVRMMQIGDFSRELCGGTHLHSSAEVGAFVISSESSVGAGLRRIEACCGLGAIRYMKEKAGLLAQVATALDTPEEQLLAHIAGLQNELRQAERTIASMQQKQAGNLAVELSSRAEKVGEVAVVAAKVPALSAEALRGLADNIVERLGSGVAVLASVGEEQAPMVAKVSPDLVKKGLHAGKLIGAVAKIAGGGGGGRPDFAQAGAKDLTKLDEALAQVPALVAQQAG